MNTAEKIIKPIRPGIFRIVFLYTGQGESTLLVVPSGPNVEDYTYILLDSDRDKEENEIDLVDMFKDLYRTSGKLSVFINTHPHNDHIGGIKEIYDEIGFDEVWHSNHTPGGVHREKYAAFKYVLNKVGKRNEYFLRGTNEFNKLRTSADTEVVKKVGMVDFQVISPAEYLCDEIDDADADERNARIHEQCGVIKFIYGRKATGVLFTGDSDKKAWRDHITNYHSDSLPSVILSASHHGSRTFFKETKEDEDVYEEHLSKISPTYLIISAPKQEESPHEHPHDDALELYKKYIDDDGIFHLGAGPYSLVVDIDESGDISNITIDKELINAYGRSSDGGDGEKIDLSRVYIGSQTTRLDNKPMGQ